MPYDGILTKRIANELNDILSGMRIERVFMPERTEVVLILRGHSGGLRLSLRANPSVPGVNLTERKKDNPNNPPMFCMFLRKHIGGGLVKSVSSYGYERVLIFNVESSNELGDLSEKRLIVEIMGKHSNIILANAGGVIMDCIKHIDFSMSSKREVMPARLYEYPPAQNKLSPEDVNNTNLSDIFMNSEGRADKVILNNILGFSPVLAVECCYRAGVDPLKEVEKSDDTAIKLLITGVMKIIKEIKENHWYDAVYYSGKGGADAVDFHCIELTHQRNRRQTESCNHAVDKYYSCKSDLEKLTQNKNSLLKIINRNIDRCVKKSELQRRSVEKSKNYKELQKLGELLTANIYAVKYGDNEVSLIDYYSETGEMITVPLQAGLSPQQNAQRYFKQYSKQKKTFEQAGKHFAETQDELGYLESVVMEIEHAADISDLAEIREELVAQGYLKRHIIKSKNRGSAAAVSLPHRYKSSDGTIIFAGRNNKMNDMLTLKSSSPGDIWLHTQKIHGSHIIIKQFKDRVSDKTLEEAAMIAAWHSRGKHSAKVPVDYTFVKNVKKPPGAKPGMVTYDKFKTLITTPVEEEIDKLLYAYKDEV